jgi:hypothetical protein
VSFLTNFLFQVVLRRFSDGTKKQAAALQGNPPLQRPSALPAC